MCTVLLAYRYLADAPVVLVANRDEFSGRASNEPGVLNDAPRIVGGKDALTGGTWLAVCVDGRVATVTNRLCAGLDPARRSRGELPVDLLLSRDVAPRRWVSRLEPAHYNPFNILYVSPDEALVGHGVGSGAMDVVDLDAGLHVLTLRDVDQADDPKVTFLAGELEAAARETGSVESLLGAMEDLMCEHGDSQRADLDATCVHGDGYGTVSSSSVVVRASGEMRYRFAPGPPCRTPRQDISALLQDGLDYQSQKR